MLLLILLLGASCFAQPGSAEKSSVTTEVRKMLLAYCSDVRAHGLNAEFKYLDSSEQFFWIPPGYNNALAYDSIAKILRSSQGSFRSIDNSFDTLHIVPLTPSLAAYAARIRSMVTDNNRHTVTTMLVENGVVVKRKTGWKLLNGHTEIVKSAP